MNIVLKNNIHYNCFLYFIIFLYTPKTNKEDKL